MNVVLAKTETGRPMESILSAARDRLPGTAKVGEVRQQAFEAYERAGLPSRCQRFVPRQYDRPAIMGFPEAVFKHV